MTPLWMILRKARHAANLTQAAAAEKLGVSASCLANIESDTSRRPSYETLSRMVEAYKVDPRVLFQDDWKPAGSELAAFMRSCTLSGEDRWQILSSLDNLGLAGMREKVVAAAKELGVLYIPVKEEKSE